MSNFNTPYNRIKTPPEENSGEYLVQSTGYVPMKLRIESMIQAGRNLLEQRNLFYHFTNEDNARDASIDPTLDKGLDPVEAQEILEQSINSITEAASAEAALSDSKEESKETSTPAVEVEPVTEKNP